MLLRRYYAVQLRAPIEPDLAVFAAYWYRGYSCNPRAIYEKLREEAPWVRGVWIVEAQHAGSFPPEVEHVIAGTRDYYRLIARAKYFVNNVNFPNDFVKREGTIHVQTHHGTPLKTMGLDLREAYVASERMNFDRLLGARPAGTTASARTSSRPGSGSAPIRSGYETLEIGYPRNDVLVNADAGADRPDQRRARHRARTDDGALRADAPRVSARNTCPPSTSGGWPRSSGPST